MASEDGMEIIFNRFFRYLKEFNVLLYKNHYYAVSYLVIGSYLTSYHKELSSNTRSKLISYIKSLFTDNPYIPIKKIPEIPELPIYFGLKCDFPPINTESQCGFIYISEKYIKDHG